MRLTRTTYLANEEKQCKTSKKGRQLQCIYIESSFLHFVSFEYVCWPDWIRSHCFCRLQERYYLAATISREVSLLPKSNEVSGKIASGDYFIRARRHSTRKQQAHWYPLLDLESIYFIVDIWIPSRSVFFVASRWQSMTEVIHIESWWLLCTSTAVYVWIRDKNRGGLTSYVWTASLQSESPCRRHVGQ